MEYKILNMQKEHWEQVKQIYCEGIETGIATFQTEIPSYEQWDNSHLKFGRFVACNEEKVLWWVALSPTSSKCVYSGVVEISIYIGKDFRGNGIGKSLMKEAIKQGEEKGIWSFYSEIIEENIVHKKCGFREIGIREKIEKLSNGKWSDTVLMEFRSKTVGIDYYKVTLLWIEVMNLEN